MSNNVTIKDTKQVIFDAYQAAVKELAAAKAGKFDPVADKKAKEIKAAKEDAKAIVELGILNDEIVEKYKNLETAIALQEAELKEYYDIQKEVDSIIALIEAKRKIIAELDAQYEAAKAEWEKRIADEKAAYAETVENIMKDRKRDAEEYAYKLKRDRQVENDKWQDEKAKREAALSAREEAVKAREEAMQAKEAEIADLQAKVDGIPAAIAEAVSNATAKAEREANARIESEVAIKKRELSVENRLLQTQLDAAIDQLENANAENKVLNMKLEAAQERVQEIATQAVRSAQPRVMESSSK